MINDPMMDTAGQELYISALLGSPELFAQVNHILKPDYFDPHLQKGVKFIQTFFQEHRGVPAPEVFSAKTGLKTTVSPVTKQDIEFLANNIEAFCQTQAVIAAVLQAPKIIETGDFQKLVLSVKAATEISLSKDLGIEYFANPMERLVYAEEAQVVIPTGWPTVDAMIGGGVSRQELITFVANSGGGKSVGMLNLGHNLLRQGLNGVYISLEMRGHLVAQRLDSMISMIGFHTISSNKEKVAHEVELAKENCGRFFIHRMREGTTNANDIIAYLRQLESRKGVKLDFVIVDYLDIMAPLQKGYDGNMFLKDKFVSEEVRAIGFDFNCIMISASQLGRGAIEVSREGKQLGQDHIQGGISKINTSDLTIALVRTEAMDQLGQYRFEFLKARNSDAVNKSLMMAWDKVSLRISDLDSLVLKVGKPSTSSKAFGLAPVRPGASQAP